MKLIRMRKLLVISGCLLVSLACNTNSSFIGCEDCGVEPEIDAVYDPKDYIFCDLLRQQ